MMTRFSVPLPICCLGAVAAALAWPVAGLAGSDGAVPAQTTAFVQLVRTNGCTITEAEGEALLPAAALTPADAVQAVEILNRGGLFSVDDDGETLRLIPALCVADGAETDALLSAAARTEPRAVFQTLTDRVAPDDALRLLRAIRAGDCSMTEAQAGATLPALGFNPEMTQDIAAVLFGPGLADFANDALRLSAEICQADPADDPARIAAALALTDPAAFPDYVPGLVGVRTALSLIALESDCILDLDTPDAAQGLAGLVLAAYGQTDLAQTPPAAMTDLVTAFLADPGPSYAAEPGLLRLIPCSY